MSWVLNRPIAIYVYIKTLLYIFFSHCSKTILYIFLVIGVTPARSKGSYFFVERLISIFESALKERLSSSKYLDFPIHIFRFLFFDMGRGVYAYPREDFCLLFFTNGWDEVLINKRGTKRSIHYPVYIKSFFSKSTKVYFSDAQGSIRPKKQRLVQRLMVTFMKETTNPWIFFWRNIS